MRLTRRVRLHLQVPTRQVPQARYTRTYKVRGALLQAQQRMRGKHGIQAGEVRGRRLPLRQKPAKRRLPLLIPRINPWNFKASSRNALFHPHTLESLPLPSHLIHEATGLIVNFGPALVARGEHLRAVFYFALATLPFGS